MVRAASVINNRLGWFAANAVQQIRVGSIDGYQYKLQTQEEGEKKRKQEGKQNKKRKKKEN